MIYKIKEYKNKLIEKAYREGMKEFNKFFGINLEYNKEPDICILNSRKEIDLLKRYKSERWVNAFVIGGKGNIVYILDNNRMEKESSHKKHSDNEYSALIKHEICHLFEHVVSKNCYKPLWLGDGLAVYLSGQLKFYNKINTFSNFIESYDKYNKSTYTEGGNACMLLIENFGKKKILRLISRSSEVNNKNDFAKLFKKIYGFDLSYKNFNNLLNKNI